MSTAIISGPRANVNAMHEGQTKRFQNRWIWLGVAATLALQALFTYAPFMQTIFETAPLRPMSWGRILAFGALSYVAVEIEKSLVKRRRQVRPGVTLEQV